PYSPLQAEMCRACFGGRVIGRIKRNVAVREADADVNSVMSRLAQEHPNDYARGRTIRVALLLDRLIGPIRGALWMLFGAVALVLLIACANVASLQVARAIGRRREFAVRAALGSGRGRLATQLLVENVLLAVSGGGIGLLVGWIGTAAIVSLAPRELPPLPAGRAESPVLVGRRALRPA